MKTTIETITDEQIETLLREAREAGDMMQVAICRRALDRLGGTQLSDWELDVLSTMSVDAARAECARVTAAAEAMSQVRPHVPRGQQVPPESVQGSAETMSRTVFVVFPRHIGTPGQIEELQERTDIGVAATFDHSRNVLASRPGGDWWTYRWGEDAFLTRGEAEARCLQLVRSYLAQARAEVKRWERVEQVLLAPMRADQETSQ